MKKRIKGSGFKAPNYTQVPNDFFSLLNDMEDAELRVTLVMIRQTFGYHRQGFKMGLNKLAEAAGLSRNGAKAGAEMAEERGTFKRSNPDEQGSAEWELMVDDVDEYGWSASDYPGQPVTTRWSASDQQLPIKESNKEIERYSAAAKKLAELQGGAMKARDADLLNEWAEKHTEEWILKAIGIAQNAGARSSAYVDRVLIGWEANGYPKPREQKVKEAKANDNKQPKRQPVEYTEADRAVAESILADRARAEAVV